MRRFPSLLSLRLHEALLMTARLCRILAAGVKKAPLLARAKLNQESCLRWGYGDIAPWRWLVGDHRLHVLPQTSFASCLAHAFMSPCGQT
jgi:hypothetical protein